MNPMQSPNVGPAGKDFGNRDRAFSGTVNSLVSFHCDGCGEMTTNTTERYKLRLCDECEPDRERIELNYASHAMYGN